MTDLLAHVPGGGSSWTPPVPPALAVSATSASLNCRPGPCDAQRQTVGQSPSLLGRCERQVCVG